MSLITIVVGIFNEAYVKGKIIVSRDAAATAANLRSMEFLWRVGIVGEMTMNICTVTLSLGLYALLKRVSKDLASLSTFFGLIAISMDASYSLELFQALMPLGSGEYLKAFTPEQLNAMATLLLKSHDTGFAIGLFCFGPFFLVSGYLIFKSTYFPRAIGILYQLAGIAYLANGFVRVLAPALGARTFMIIAPFALVGEASFCFWLLFKGPNMARWNALAYERPAAAAPATARLLGQLIVGTIGLTPAIAAQSIDRAIQLFDGAKYAEAQTEFAALQKANGKSAPDSLVPYVDLSDARVRSKKFAEGIGRVEAG